MPNGLLVLHLKLEPKECTMSAKRDSIVKPVYARPKLTFSFYGDMVSLTASGSGKASESAAGKADNNEPLKRP